MIKKIIIGLVVFFILAIGALVAIPFLFKDEINAAVKEEINNNLKAKVDYGDYDLSLLRSFPNFSFQLSNFSIVGVEDFKGDTLAFIPDLRFTIDVMSVYKKEKYKILQILLDKPLIKAIVNKEGKANWDIAKEDPSKPKAETTSQNFSLQINKYAIKEGNISYEDFKGKTFAYLEQFNFEGSGDVTETIYDFKTKTGIEKLTFKSGTIPYLSKAKIVAENNITINQSNQQYTFKENTINVNDLALLFDGFVILNKEDYSLNFTFKSKEASFKSILSLIPAIYQKDFDKIKTAGSLALSGAVKGVYSEKTLPGFDLNLQVANAMFQYPSLPTAVTNIQINAKINKAQGDLDKMNIDVTKFHADLGTDPIDAKLKVSTPISNPYLDLALKGKLNLANVPKFYPIEDLKKISGLLVADLTFQGRKSDIDLKRYTAVKAGGNLSITNMVYDSKSTPMPLNVSDVRMTFNPQNINLTNLTAKVGKSDYQMNGSLENYMAYVFNQGDLKGSLNLKSNFFDADEWLKTDDKNNAAKASSPESNQFFQIPANLDFDANATFGKVNYDKLVLTNAKGNVKIKDETIYLNDIYANTLGGNATISATYSTAKSTTPKVNFNYDIKNFDFNETYKFVGMAEKIAPIIKYVNGNFSSDLKGSGTLKEDMSVDYNTLQGDGKVSINTARIVGLPMLAKIAEVTKIPALQNLSINNAWTVMQFADGKVKVEPTDIKFGNGYNINFGGKNGFDQSIDYDVRFDVPSKELGGATSYVTNLIPKVPGINFAMPETVNLFLKVGGTMAKPIVKLQKVGAAGGSAKDMIKNTVDDLKNKAEEEARKQAEVLKQKAQEEADKIKKDLENKAKQEADKVKNQVEDKAKDVIKGIKLPW